MKSTVVTIHEVIFGIAALNGMEISKAYANTCYADTTVPAPHQFL